MKLPLRGLDQFIKTFGLPVISFCFVAFLIHLGTLLYGKLNIQL
jgi:hypothetical protein